MIDVNGEEDIQIFFDKLTTDGWQIIYYNEKIKSFYKMNITVVCKKNN